MAWRSSTWRRSGAAGPAALAAAALLGAVSLTGPSFAAGEYWVLPAAELDPPTDATMEVAIFAGGCFWGIQAVFQYTEGVITAVSGYAGGTAETANYSDVSSGSTGHAEAVEVVYNPQEISYGELLRIFFSVGHDPTTLDRQGSDAGPQYRSNIFYTNDRQRQVAEAYITQLDAAGVYEAEIVTRLDPLAEFFPAEAYHQDYLVNDGAGDPYGPNIGYLNYWDRPKLENLQALFPEYWRDDPVTVAETRPELALDPEDNS